MVGEELEVCVIEVDRDRRRLIFSEWAASSENKKLVKDEILNELERRRYQDRPGYKSG